MILRILFCILLVAFCSSNTQAGGKKETTGVSPAKDSSCRDCHQFELDKQHAEITCIVCHAGSDPAASKEAAHLNMLRQPAHPRHLAQTCGTCHNGQVDQATQSLHFTLKKEVNSVRRAFGAKQDLDSLVSIPQHEEIGSELALAEDMLRRRCLRCHLYYSGDQYPETRHGTGCAACHMNFSAGKATSHSFIKSPPDSQCLHCHYGNFVGADYAGRFEHDFHWDYRTPYTKEGKSLRPYGVEYHQLSKDIHSLAGLACIDCHSGIELMGNSKSTLTCTSCHLQQVGAELPLDNLNWVNGALRLTCRLSGQTLDVPQIKNPVHDRYRGQADCTVCHAQWAFSDEATHLFRLDTDDFEPWSALYVQGSSEVEREVFSSLYGDDVYEYVFMSDKITGELYSGIWMKGYEMRRWEFPIICRDDSGVLHTCRPILDLHLTFVNEDGELIYDAITPAHGPDMGLVPYTPHTIGKAGAFFRQRLQENTELLKLPLNMEKEKHSGKQP